MMAKKETAMVQMITGDLVEMEVCGRAPPHGAPVAERPADITGTDNG